MDKVLQSVVILYGCVMMYCYQFIFDKDGVYEY